MRAVWRVLKRRCCVIGLIASREHWGVPRVPVVVIASVRPVVGFCDLGTPQRAPVLWQIGGRTPRCGSARWIYVVGRHRSRGSPVNVEWDYEVRLGSTLDIRRGRCVGVHEAVWRPLLPPSLLLVVGAPGARKASQFGRPFKCSRSPRHPAAACQPHKGCLPPSVLGGAPPPARSVKGPSRGGRGGPLTASRASMPTRRSARA
ncbi:hypothetical protein Efla_004633 [Eimeria flavescens]